MRALILLGIPGLVIGMGSAAAQTVSQEDAMRAAIHPVGDATAMQAWLSRVPVTRERSEEPTSALQSLMRISYAVLCLNTKNKQMKPLNSLRTTAASMTPVMST